MSFGRYYNGTGWLEPMVTYAQNFEDVTLRRAFPDIDRGFYVDIGGFHPSSHSVTKHFYEKNWTGVNVEPNPPMLSLFKQDRPRDANLGLAVGSSRREVELHIVGDTGLTSTVKEVAQAHGASGHIVTQVLTVLMITLDDLFSEFCANKTVDFLKVDVEGAEAEVLNPCGFEKVRPRVILAENSNDFHDVLISKGYVFCWYDGLNRWYVRAEDEWRCDLIARPISVWDGISNIARPW